MKTMQTMPQKRKTERVRMYFTSAIYPKILPLLISLDSVTSDSPDIPELNRLVIEYANKTSGIGKAIVRTENTVPLMSFPIYDQALEWLENNKEYCL